MYVYARMNPERRKKKSTARCPCRITSSSGVRWPYR